MNEISSLAVIHPDAKLGQGNMIGPFSVVGPNVTIGNDNWIGSNVVLGAPPEHRGHHESSLNRRGSWLEIGSGNVIHEFTAVQEGTIEPTRIGNKAFLMARANVGHDCLIADGVTLSPNVILAGHVRIGRSATIGMLSCIHQRTFIGAYSMVGMGSQVSRDVPPFALVVASNRPPARIGLNEVAIERNGLSGAWSNADFLNDDEVLVNAPEEVRDALLEWRTHSSR